MKYERCYMPEPYREPLLGRIAYWSIITLCCVMSVAVFIFVYWGTYTIQEMGGLETVFRLMTLK